MAADPSILDAAARICRAGEAAYRRAEFEAAETAFRQCLEVHPGYPPALHGLGAMAFAAGDHADAVSWLQQVVQAEPRAGPSWLLLTRAHIAQGDDTAAQRTATALLKLSPQDPDAHCNRGNAESSAGRWAAASRHYQAALRLNPRHEESLVQRRKAGWMLGRGWESLACAEQLARDHPHNQRYRSELICGLCGESGVDETRLYHATTAWARSLAAADVPPARRRADRVRPRLGIYSSTLHEHVVSRFLLPILTAWPRHLFDGLHLFSDGPVSDAVTTRYRSLASSWVPLHGVPDAAASARLDDAGLDVLIDINGHFDHARPQLLARRPAAVIAHYLGGTSTTGLRAITHRISDPIAEPPGESDRWSTEKILRLERGCHAYAPLRAAAPIAPSPAETHPLVTFGTTANLHKLNAEVLHVWGQILRRVPGSQLLLTKEVFADPESCADIAARLVAGGIPRSQLVLQPAARSQFHTGEAWRDIDIALDPFPYNGVTTTCEALWMGVPVVTLRGRRLTARMGASLLTNAGHPEWIAGTGDDYVRIAADLAANRTRLAHLRTSLRAELEASPLGRPAELAGELSRVLLDTWHATPAAP